jgi:hypothetical protein
MLRTGILEGAFSDTIREQFVRMLEYFGQSPVIVRSSSLLEDSFGHAFAGKYESVFCVNTGTPEARLEAFENAVRTVYASTMDMSALAYRRQRGLQDLDEQMAILVQRVSGSLFGTFFMPVCAGVGYSFNTWRWHRDVPPEAGMLRIVAGLGTRAVDRTGDDYPRLISPARPDLEPVSGSDKGWYCQRSLDVLDLSSGRLATVSMDTLAEELPPWLLSIIAAHDREAERYLSETGNSRDVLVASCDGAVCRPELLNDLGAIMKQLADAYCNPVDIEFTVNWTPDGAYLINLLQCRPLQTLTLLPRQDSEMDTSVPRIRLLSATELTHNPLSIFFRLAHTVMGPQLQIKIDAVILVDPLAYYAMPWRDKPTVARVVGMLNAHYGKTSASVLLISPGRLGTTSPELGLPVTFAEIDNFSILCERSYSEAGYRPELSFGSHFFQDLVENGIYYAAIPELRATDSMAESDPPFRYAESFFEGETDLLPFIIADSGIPAGVIRVYEPDNLWFASDALSGTCICCTIGG